MVVEMVMELEGGGDFMVGAGIRYNSMYNKGVERGSLYLSCLFSE